MYRCVYEGVCVCCITIYRNTLNSILLLIVFGIADDSCNAIKKRCTEFIFKK